MSSTRLNPALILQNLEGRWKVVRHISDKGNFNGEVVFTKTAPTELASHETGQLELLSGENFLSSRNMIYSCDGDILRIIYNDPFRKKEIMHELEFDDQAVARHVHICGSDRYDLTFAYQKEKVTMDYIVTGPNKSYEMKTILSRFDF